MTRKAGKMIRMRFKRKVQFVLPLLTAGFIAACQPADPVAGRLQPAAEPRTISVDLYPQLFARVDQAIETEMQDNYLPGVAVVIVRDGETVYKRGYGVESIETGNPVDPDRTIFRIGSTTKALTLLALTRLIDDGRLAGSDDVANFVSGIENEYGFETPVTIDNLLTHTSGFDQPGYGRQIGDFDQPLEQRQAARTDLSSFLANRNLRRINPPGEYFRYDTYGATLAGAILERVTGLPYAAAMQQELFGPLGMERSAVEVAPQNRPDLASGYGYIEGEYVRAPYEVYVTLPASSIDATTADMGRLLEALTGGGANSAGRLYSGPMAQAVLSPQYRPHPDFAGITHGLWESFALGRGAEAIPVRTLEHGGDMWGFNGRMVVIPEYNLGFYVVTNRNQEGGGPRVNISRPVMLAIMEVLDPGRTPVPAPVPARNTGIDLGDYDGDYYWGVYCHTCTAAEVEMGAWRRAEHPRHVISSDGALEVDSEIFLPAGGDVFVQDDGYQQIFFRRSEAGRITSFSYRDGPTVFERVE